MKAWRTLSALLLLAIMLAACGQGQTGESTASTPPVPTSDTEALQTDAPQAEASASTDVTEVANEEVTTPPESITITPSDQQSGSDEGYGQPAEDLTSTAGGEAFTPGGTATGEWDCGDQSRLDDQLAIFSWADYWDEELLNEFSEACGVEVTLDTYPSNEDLAARLRAGNSGYDIVLPSDYMVDILVQENRLAQLDTSALPNLANLDPQQMSLYYDPNNNYSVPFQYGMTGIGYNSAEVNPAPTSWAALFDPAQVEQYGGSVLMLDDEREGVGAALKYRGYSYNSTDPAELQQAQEALLAQRDYVAYNSESQSQGLASGEVVLAHSWNGAASLAKSENPDIEWVLPEEGGAIWQDTLAIPADAPHVYTAHVFLNNVLDGQIGARITDFTYYLTPNKAAEPLVSEEVRALQYYPTDEMRQRLEYIERRGDPALYSDVWTQVKGQ